MSTRVAAYALCVEDDRILLAHWADGEPAHWGLPGGGLEFGEDPLDALHREVEEETGHTVEVERLLGIVTARHERLHAIKVIYKARVTGGTLRDEVGGSTDTAAWIPLAELPSLPRVEFVDRALDLDDLRPPSGRLVTGMRRGGLTFAEIHGR
ncbi:NUDIX hydrolase [Nonomuraea africana]|uniref:ADP-ribose pyrophosphatase YjhB (NUDIX family) n=1 Tax=Nonomuraea africana TaxID=46171 RepID=A0ABR9K713_9ACTN|nr:NUDIX hydrolase [Nonomuraea africana]MBE1557791.1 ADP-ribose pyrophosphatase YjhB (NUDIX family) [Nonomuraea africana]